MPRGPSAEKLEPIKVPSINSGCQNIALHVSLAARKSSAFILCLPGSFNFISPVFFEGELTCVMNSESDFDLWFDEFFLALIIITVN